MPLSSFFNSCDHPNGCLIDSVSDTDQEYIHICIVESATPSSACTILVFPYSISSMLISKIM